MNERINELAEQAKEYARKHVADCRTYGYYMEYNEYELQFEKKFAELIVKECIAQCAKNVDHEYLGWGSKLSAFNIKQHFGVEE